MDEIVSFINSKEYQCSAVASIGSQRGGYQVSLVDL
jgi:hypothetical protein